MSFLLDNPKLIEESPGKQSQLRFMKKQLNATFDARLVKRETKRHSEGESYHDSKLTTFASSFKCKDFIRE